MTYSKVPGKRKLPGTYPHKTCISCQAREKAERYTKKAADALLASGNRSVPAYGETPDTQE